MKIIGITGGIGCGKSTVLNLLEKHYNAYIIKADDVAKETMKPGNAGYNKVIEIFGNNILQTNGEIDRPYLASIVFSNKNKLAVLNSIVHPLVKKLITEEIARLKCIEKYDYVFIEAALLIEAHYEIICDELWYIHTADDIRRERLKKDRGYDDRRIDDTFNNQLSENEYRKHCKIVIENNSSISETLSQLKKALE